MAMRSNFRSGKQVKVGKIGNPRSRKPTQPIQTSRILLIVLGCVFVGVVFIFTTSLHFITQSNSSTNNANNNRNIKADDHHYYSPPEHHEQKESKFQQLLLENLGPPPSISLEDAKQSLQAVKVEFYNRYGGKNLAESMFSRTITSFGNVQDTAEQILRSVAQQTDFVMGFAGYSITVGRGNFFNQSFPFVVERVLAHPMKAIGVKKFYVRNSAIGGIPSFPYAYCLDHFVSRDTDILSWDFSMNEKAKDPAVFEAYLRQALHQLPKQPTIIMVDNNPVRTKLLEEYVTRGLLKGAITVAKADSVIDKTLLDKSDTDPTKPKGLQQWEKFGAPDGCPGKGSWHPKMKEHEFMGWMISMHFVQALELVFQIQQQNPTSWYTKYSHALPTSRAIFPDPISNPLPENDESVTEILFGHKKIIDDGGGGTTTNQYQMKELSCRTNFLPATDSEKVLDTLVVSGMNRQATTDNIMDVRNDDYYSKGWVLDVSQVERDTKRKVEKCGGLGYIDMKIALYGIPQSGTLELFLPYEGEPHDHDHDTSSTTATDAQHWFDGVIICEANDKRPKEACQLDRDIEYIVGGVKVTDVVMINGAGEYLKRKTCVNVGVPKGAQTTTTTTTGQADNQLGLQVKITAKGEVTRKAGACCISHVVWEQH